MGREVRKVPKGWEHPKDRNGQYIPLLAGTYSQIVKDWDEANEQWQKGLRKDWETNGWKPIEAKYLNIPFEEWDGDRPKQEHYMPEWPDATLLMMYEDTTEGTPISPAFESPEELARWLADNGASAFGDLTATYEQWLATIHAGYAVGAVMSHDGFQSGVAYAETVCGKDEEKTT